ncbi:Kelch repeat-containing protein 3 [Ophidiomyces ophidiicola]|nr:Kelch repeat-containing protein 3 [Ophidiomyces ophidiicola]KAI1991132.1 Kelch repeat-containing protein 3 [Ophidiomyces ophidiicola]KAI1996312.1 Kelch repeat-containing protein 3 [Ophidiomyces ophidiicola]
MGVKDKKAKKAEQKARATAKQAKKAAQKEKKGKAKSNAQDDSDAEDVDLDAVLAAYAEEQAKFLKVTEASSSPPRPRSSSTLIASPSNRNELFVFGGEFYDGALASFFNNLYVYLIDRNEWREVTSPNSPLPRSGHAWCRGGNAGGIYLFGGEFSSPKQGTFYHYNDFWHLDPSTREWTRLETKSKGPPARSGHRMTYFKNYIILFGGFQDTSQQTKYLQDLWIYDCLKYTWYNPVLPPASQKPDARSSFSLLPHEAGAVVYGGYSRVKMSVTAGKGQKGGPQRMALKPVVHQDTWFLRITPPTADAPANTQPTVRWERRKKPANPPNPPRAGVTMAYHKGRGILFGGVHDVEATEEGIDSEFFDLLYAWNVERNRFFQLSLRRPRAGNKKQQTASQMAKSRNRTRADEEELLQNLARLEAKGGLTPDIQEMDIDTATKEDEETEAKLSLPVKFEMPHPRFNAQLAVQEDTLFIFGGTFERNDQEFTFNDLYSIDLMKLDGVKEIFYEEPEHWNDIAEAESDEEMEEDEIEESDNEEEDTESAYAPSTVPTEVTEATPMETDADQELTEPQPQDSRPHPRPFENLRDFYTRTSTEWQELLLAKLRDSDSATEKTIKELRKDAFDLAEEKWWDCREEITALEDEQEEAGIGEVVSMSERGDIPSAGRRR